jgi:CheY-like chemotaxis protein
MTIAANAQQPARAQRHVLVVEDNLTTSEMFQEYLGLHGFRVSCAFNGREAIEAVARDCPDLVVMDIQMPEMDGFEAMRHLRANPALVRLPILAVTALASRAQIHECLTAGADDYLSTPIRMKELLTHINNLLEASPGIEPDAAR